MARTWVESTLEAVTTNIRGAAVTRGRKHADAARAQLHEFKVGAGDVVATKPMLHLRLTETMGNGEHAGQVLGGGHVQQPAKHEGIRRGVCPVDMVPERRIRAGGNCSRVGGALCVTTRRRPNKHSQQTITVRAASTDPR